MKKQHLLKWLNEGSVSIPNLLLQNYSLIGLNETECMLLIHIYSFIEKGNNFPTPEELSERMTLSSEACMQTIQKLFQLGILSIEKHTNKENNYFSESYSLAPLWEKLLTYINVMEGTEEWNVKEESVYTLFEQEFARPLSPIECETLSMWIDQDHHSVELIRLALKEAVLSGKLNFKYIDRILLEWKKNGIKTVEQAKLYSEKFRKHQLAKPSEQDRETKKEISYPFYNWL